MTRQTATRLIPARRSGEINRFFWAAVQMGSGWEEAEGRRRQTRPAPQPRGPSRL